MTVQDQIKLSNSTYFKKVMIKALNKACGILMETYQNSGNRTKKMHNKVYAFALQFSKSCTISDSVFNSCISNLLDGATYIDPSVNADEATTALFDIIKADYEASFIQDGGNSKYPSWIERIAGYELEDEDPI